MRLPAVVAALLACASLLPAAGNGEQSITVYYSSSLNGNLDGCQCRGNPRAGLVKRAAWLRAQREVERSVLVDAGDILDVYPDDLLARGILESYADLGYDAVAVGDQEFANGIDRLLEYREGSPLLSNNLALCPDENRCVFFSVQPLLISRSGIRVGVFALIDPEVFALYPGELTNALKISAPADLAPVILEELREEGAELTILLYHGPYERARELALQLRGLDVLVLGHEQRLIDAEAAGDTTIVSPGAEGNRLGILTVSLDPRGRRRVDNRFELFRWETSPDDPAVRRRIAEYREAMRGRVIER